MPLQEDRLRGLFGSREGFKVSVNRNDRALFPQPAASSDPFTSRWAIGVSPLNTLRCLDPDPISDADSDNICATIVAEQLDSPAICSDLTLTKLTLSPETTGALFMAVKSSKNLIKLLLWQCTLGNVGDSLFNAFSTNDRIKLLDLTDCNIGDDGAVKLAQALISNQTLRKVNLHRNRIRDAGGKALGDALSHNSTLFTLHLSENSISEDGAKGLADGLMTNDTLGVLRLTRNVIGTEGGKYLAEMIKSNRGLLELDLSWCSIGKEGLTDLLGSLQYNPAILKLEILEGNKCGDDHGSGEELKQKVQQRIDHNKQRQRQLFQEALRENASAEWGRTRLLFIGQGKAGKTATVRALLRQPFVETHDSTVGADLTQLSTRADKESGWAKQNDDFTSRHAARILAAKHFEKEGNSSSRRRRSSKKIQSPKVESKTISNKKKTNFYRNSNELVMMRARRRFSLPGEPGRRLGVNPQRRVSGERATGINMNVGELAGAFNIDEFMKRPYEQTLAFRARHDREALNFTLWDFGGQEVFYTMHHLFMSSHGLYFLVFNCKEVINLISSENNDKNTTSMERPEKYLKFWLNSVAVHAADAPVILVGTHLDELDGGSSSLQLLHDFIQPVVAKVKSVTTIENKEEGICFFPVDNKTLVGIHSLQLVIEREARAQGHVEQLVPLRWMALLDKLIEVSKNNPSSTTSVVKKKDLKRTLLKNEGPAWLSLDEVKHFARNFEINSTDEINEMLELFNELGVLIYLTSCSSLREKIVLKPQWLLDVLGKVIRDGSIHHHEEKFIELKLEEDLKLAHEKGLFSRDLLEFLWRDEDIEFLLDLMKQTMLLSEWDFSKSAEVLYLVPSLLRAEPAQKLQNSGSSTNNNERGIIGKTLKKFFSLHSIGKEKNKESKRLLKSKCHKCVFDFSERYLPTGVFERVICIIVSWDAQGFLSKGVTSMGKTKRDTDCDIREPILAKNFCEFFIEGEEQSRVRLVQDEENLTITLSMHEGAEGEHTIELHASRCLKMLEEMLIKINDETMRSGLTWKTSFVSVDNVVSDSESAKEAAMFPWFSLALQNNLFDENDVEAFLDLT